MKKIVLLTGLFLAILSFLPGHLRAQYCIPVYKTGCSTGDSVTYFQLGTYSRTSGCSNFTHLSKVYKGYDSTGIVIPIFRGKTYPIVVANANTNQNFGVWIDWNQDGDFADSGETIINDNNRTDSLNSSIYIPYNIKPGNYALRMMDADSSTLNFLSNSSSCLSSGLNKGETEDYILQIKARTSDAALETMLSPSLYTCSGSSQSVKVVIRNQGSDSLTSIPVVLNVGGSTYTDTLKKTLKMNLRDTFTFATTSISLSAGSYPFSIYTNLASDSDRTNDTIKGTIVVGTTPSSPTGSSTSICAAGKGTLIASCSTSGTKIHWYASATSDTDLYIGDTFTTPKLTKATTYYAESQILKWDTVNTDTTLTSSTVRSNNGNMFDIVAKADIQIDSFYIKTYSSGKDVAEVYYKEGSYVGNETKSKAWTFVGRDTVYGAGYSGGLIPAYVRFTTPFKAGHTYGIYIRLQTGNVAYDVGSRTFNSPEITLKTGNSVAGKFGTPMVSGSSFVTPRTWNGEVFYHVITCPSSRTALSVNFASLQAGYKYNNTCSGTVFTDTSKTTGSGTINSWRWDFGDSTSSTTQSPTHNYKYGGTKKVKLVVGFSGGCKDSVTTSIIVNASPKADFSVANTCFGDSVMFTNKSLPSGSSLTYSWDFGDKTTGSTLTNPNHKYASTGAYNVRLITTYSGCNDTIKKSVTINAKPTVKFGYTAYCNSETIRFSDSSFTVGGGSYSWDFGDASTKSTATNPSHTYSSFSSFTATLKITSKTNGCMDSFSLPINFYTGSKASFNFVDSVCSGLGTSFTNTNVTKGAKYSWDFGDGTKLSAKDTTHYYAKGGSFVVKLIAINTNGCNDTMTKTVNVKQSPNTTFSFTKLGFQKYKFIPVDTTLTSFTWNFGDTTKDIVNIKPTHAYKNNVMHYITLSATAANKCSSNYKDSTGINTGIFDNSTSSTELKVYPNPFKDNTTISYNLESNTRVHIEIVDLTGRTITVLANSSEGAGAHSVLFEPAAYKVQSGVYILHVSIGDEIQTKQLIYVK